MSSESLKKLQRAVSNLSSLDSLPRTLAKLKVVADSSRTLVGEMPGSVFRRRLCVFHNKTHSLKGGLDSLEYTYEDLLRYRQKAVAFLKEAESFVGVSQSKIKQLEATFGSSETAVNHNDTDAESDRKIDHVFRGAEDALIRYSSFKPKLRALKGKNYIITQVPIIPVSSPPLQSEKLASLGFQFDKIGGYVALENQIVLGIDATWLREQQEDGLSQKELIDLIVGTIEKKSKKKYDIFLGPSKDYAKWVWLVEERQLNRLMSACMGGRFKNVSWGFAF